MFEGAVAGILNRLLGKYVQDLDTENLNVGIFSGNVNLTDLKLKPEALYELDLPIDVKIGTIGRISFQIPWTGLYTQPVIVNIEDVLLLVGPAISNSYFDPERERRLTRAAKRKILQDLEAESEILKGPQNFFESLFTAIVNNIQIYVRNVHVRYEDSISSKDGPLACGLCLQKSLSLYWNPVCTALDDAETAHITPMQYYNWKHYMLTGLDKFSMHREDFEFCKHPRYRHLHPGLPLVKNERKWWRYAFNVVIEQRVRPYTWAAIKRHRENYNVYKKTYKSTLRSPNDTELKLDLQKCEDSLPIISVVIAREQAKFELLSQEPERIEVVETEFDWWKPSSPTEGSNPTDPLAETPSHVELCVKTERSRTLWSHLSSPEKKRVCELIGYVEGAPRQDKSKQYIGTTSDGDLVPLLTSERGTALTGTNLLAVDLEKNPHNMEADYALCCLMERVELLYVEHAFTELINFMQTRSMSSEELVEEVSLAVEKAKVISRSVVTYAIHRRKVFHVNVDVKAPCIVLPDHGCLQKSGRLMIVDISRIIIKSDLQPNDLALEDATCMELEEKLCYSASGMTHGAMPVPTAVPLTFLDSGDCAEELEDPELIQLLVSDRVQADPGYSDLVKLRQKILTAPGFAGSEHSDEDLEVFARSVDLPGFEDNVSPSEIVINLSRSTEQVDKPYIMLSITKLCLDVALMQYGPAIQLSVAGALLTDKQHHSSNGQYLELLATDCPEFRSHFHAVEQALVCDTGHVSLLLHAPALQTLAKYLQYITNKIQSRHAINLRSVVVPKTRNLWEHLMKPEADPPVPSGATKFSYSVRSSSISIKLCHTEYSMLELRLGALESDCVFRANDRMTLKLFLSSLQLDDLGEATLYPKYVRCAPRLYGVSSELKAHGELRLYVGRLHCVASTDLFHSTQQFIEPLIPSAMAQEASSAAERAAERHSHGFRAWSTRLNLVIEIHAPVLLLPQKPSSPNLLVLNMGDLLIENFFKHSSSHDASSPLQTPIIDNILVKLQDITFARAVMTLAGTLEVQPTCIRCDMKRCVGYQQACSSARDLLAVGADVTVDTVLLNLGQKDLATILAVWADNLSIEHFIGSIVPSSPVDVPQTDASVKKLQAFFAQGEPIRKEAAISLRAALRRVCVTLGGGDVCGATAAGLSGADVAGDGVVIRGLSTTPASACE
ncbi:putative vacuolar protein sorting-associated protein, partial [Operophtera brumata]